MNTCQNPNSGRSVNGPCQTPGNMSRNVPGQTASMHGHCQKNNPPCCGQAGRAPMQSPGAGGPGNRCRREHPPMERSCQCPGTQESNGCRTDNRPMNNRCQQSSLSGCGQAGCMPAQNQRQSSNAPKDFCQMNQSQLLSYISEVSFVVSDMLLYLDTHPDDQKALDFCNDHIALRKQALKEYARLYGPLTIDTADDNASRCWRWVETPWPWEGRLN